MPINFRKPNVNAIATPFGWADPSTGEVLVSLRGLPNQVPGFIKGIPYKHPLKGIIKEVPNTNKPNPNVIIEESVTESELEVKEEVIVEEPEPVVSEEPEPVVEIKSKRRARAKK